MMLLDVVIDPLAVRGERWFLGHVFYYPEGGVYFGVPLSNFVGWALVGWAIVGGYLWVADDAGPGAAGSPAGGRALLRGAALHAGHDRLDRGVERWPGRESSSHGLVFLVLYRHCGRCPRPRSGGSPHVRGGRRSTPFTRQEGCLTMSVPVSQMLTVASYVISQKLARTQALSAGAHARAAVPLQPRLRGLRQDPVPRPDPQKHLTVEQCLRGGGGVRGPHR